MHVGFLLEIMKMFWDQLMMIVVQPCEYSKNHRIVNFQMVNFKSELYLDYKNKQTLIWEAMLGSATSVCFPPQPKEGGTTSFSLFLKKDSLSHLGVQQLSTAFPLFLRWVNSPLKEARPGRSWYLQVHTSTAAKEQAQAARLRCWEPGLHAGTNASASHSITKLVKDWSSSFLGSKEIQTD